MRRRGFMISIRQHGIPPGISLVEVVVAMAIATVLMGLSMTTLHTIMRAERESSEAVWLGASFQRFSRLFRDDIHAAESVQLEPEKVANPKTLVILKPGGEQITWRIEEFRIDRVVSREGKVLHEDMFYVPAGSEAHFIQQQRLNQAGISIREPGSLVLPDKESGNTPESRPRAAHELAVLSTIGRDYRLTQISFEQSEKETNQTN